MKFSSLVTFVLNEVPVSTDRREAQRHSAGMRSSRVPWASQLTLLWTGISQPPDNCCSIVRDGLTHSQKTERQRDGRTDISYYRSLSLRPDFGMLGRCCRARSGWNQDSHRGFQSPVFDSSSPSVKAIALSRGVLLRLVFMFLFL